MAIHPRYAEAILDGRKGVEFRKRPLADDVTTVIIYATAPVQRIVGEFSVDRVVISSPSDLWVAAGAVGCIDFEAYRAYYDGHDRAAGIVVSRPRRYAVPVALAALDPAPAVPQSFCYLESRALSQVRAAGGSARTSHLTRLAHLLAAFLRAPQRTGAVAPVVPLPARREPEVSSAPRVAARG